MADISPRGTNMPRVASLSRRERTARTKIIQEHHYNRKEQQCLDRYVEQFHVTYHWVYTSVKGGAILSFMAAIGVDRLSTAFLKASFSAVAAADAFQRTVTAIREFWT